MYRQKRKALPGHDGQRRLERELRAQLTDAAGGTLYGNDPVASVSDQFRRSFDRLGRARAEQRAAGAQEGPAASPAPQARETKDAERHGSEERGERAARAPVGRLLRGFPTSPLPLQRFSDVAFRHGNLAGSILQGTGKMMLVSCLRRTVNPRRPEKHEAFQAGVTQKPFPGHDPDSMVFTRDLVRGAVSIVVDTLHDARRTIEMLEEKIQRGGAGAEQLFSLYPFLDDSRERELTEQYRAALEDTSDVTEHALLQSSLVHAGAMIENKARMRMDFLTALRQVTARAAQAAEEFEAPGFADDLARTLLEPEQPDDEPPPGGPPDKPNRNKRTQGDAYGTQRRSDPEQQDADAGSADG